MFLNLLFNYFFDTKCKHEKILPNLDFSYCPDCGKLISNEWYISRCACCGIKLITKIHDNEIIPQHAFCHNCGSSEFIVEKLEKINFIDINYAVLLKKEVNELKKAQTIQCWQEKNNEQPKLLAQFL